MLLLRDMMGPEKCYFLEMREIVVLKTKIFLLMVARCSFLRRDGLSPFGGVVGKKIEENVGRQVRKESWLVGSFFLKYLKSWFFSDSVEFS